MWLALTDMFRARWSDDIHEEWMRNLLANRTDLRREQLERTRELMNAHVRDCLVTGYADLIEGLELPDPGDRHVLAAALHARASVIVTYNVRHFPDERLEKYGLEAQHPDEFITHLLDLNPAAVCGAAKKQRASLKNPQKNVEEFLEALARQQLPETVSRLRQYSELI